MDVYRQFTLPDMENRELSEFKDSNQPHPARKRKEKSSSRRSSILKKSPGTARLPLEDMDPNNAEETDTKEIGGKRSRRSAGRRVSFAEKLQIKEFHKHVNLGDDQQHSEQTDDGNLLFSIFGKSSQVKRDPKEPGIFDYFPDPKFEIKEHQAQVGNVKDDVQKRLNIQSNLPSKELEKDRRGKKRKSFDIFEYTEPSDDEISFQKASKTRNGTELGNLKDSPGYLNQTCIFVDDDMEITEYIPVGKRENPDETKIFKDADMEFTECIHDNIEAICQPNERDEPSVTGENGRDKTEPAMIAENPGNDLGPVKRTGDPEEGFRPMQRAGDCLPSQSTCNQKNWLPSDTSSKMVLSNATLRLQTPQDSNQLTNLAQYDPNSTADDVSNRFLANKKNLIEMASLIFKKRKQSKDTETEDQRPNRRDSVVNLEWYKDMLVKADDYASKKPVLVQADKGCSVPDPDPCAGTNLSVQSRRSNPVLAMGLRNDDLYNENPAGNALPESGSMPLDNRCEIRDEGVYQVDGQYSDDENQEIRAPGADIIEPNNALKFQNTLSREDPVISTEDYDHMTNNGLIDKKSILQRASVSDESCSAFRVVSRVNDKIASLKESRRSVLQSSGVFGEERSDAGSMQSQNTNAAVDCRDGKHAERLLENCSHQRKSVGNTLYGAIQNTPNLTGMAEKQIPNAVGSAGTAYDMAQKTPNMTRNLEKSIITTGAVNTASDEAIEQRNQILYQMTQKAPCVTGINSNETTKNHNKTDIQIANNVAKNFEKSVSSAFRRIGVNGTCNKLNKTTNAIPQKTPNMSPDFKEFIESGNENTSITQHEFVDNENVNTIDSTGADLLGNNVGKQQNICGNEERFSQGLNRTFVVENTSGLLENATAEAEEFRDEAKPKSDPGTDHVRLENTFIVNKSHVPKQTYDDRDDVAPSSTLKYPMGSVDERSKELGEDRNDGTFVKELKCSTTYIVSPNEQSEPKTKFQPEALDVYYSVKLNDESPEWQIKMPEVPNIGIRRNTFSIPRRSINSDLVSTNQTFCLSKKTSDDVSTEDIVSPKASVCGSMISLEEITGAIDCVDNMDVTCEEIFSNTELMRATTCEERVDDACENGSAVACKDRMNTTETRRATACEDDKMHAGFNNRSMNTTYVKSTGHLGITLEAIRDKDNVISDIQKRSKDRLSWISREQMILSSTPEGHRSRNDLDMTSPPYDVSLDRENVEKENEDKQKEQTEIMDENCGDIAEDADLTVKAQLSVKDVDENFGETINQQDNEDSCNDMNPITGNKNDDDIIGQAGMEIELSLIEDDPDYQEQIERIEREKAEMESEFEELRQALEDKDKQLEIVDSLKKDIQLIKEDIDEKVNRCKDIEAILHEKQRDLESIDKSKADLQKETEDMKQRSSEAAEKLKFMEEKIETERKHAAEKTEESERQTQKMKKLLHVTNSLLEWSVTKLSRSQAVVSFWDNIFKLTVDFEEIDHEAAQRDTILEWNKTITSITFKKQSSVLRNHKVELVCNLLHQKFEPSQLLEKYKTTNNLNKLLKEVSLTVASYRKLFEDICNVDLMSMIREDGPQCFVTTLVSPVMILFTKFDVKCNILFDGNLPKIQLSIHHVSGKNRTSIFEELLRRTQPGPMYFSRTIENMTKFLHEVGRRHFHMPHNLTANELALLGTVS